MARKLHSSNLETRTARLRLPVSAKPVFVTVAEGIGCGYRRNARGAGNWTARLADGNGGYALKNIGIADDYEDARTARPFSIGGKLSMLPGGSSAARARPR